MLSPSFLESVDRPSFLESADRPSFLESVDRPSFLESVDRPSLSEVCICGRQSSLLVHCNIVQISQVGKSGRKRWFGKKGATRGMRC